MTGNYRRKDRAAFDTAVVIYALDNDDLVSQKYLEDAVASCSAVFSTITILEYCTGLYRKGEGESVPAFMDFISGNYIYIQNIDQETAVLASEFRGQYPSLKAMDALQIASALKADCNILYTADRQLCKLTIAGLDIRPVYMDA